MELRHLLYFKTVSEELHFTRAAEKLFISQPPLSRQIKELEIELGVQLFERNNKRVMLTDSGKYFLEEVNAIFLKLEAAKNKARQIAQFESGELRIGYISSLFHQDLANILKEMEILYPFVKTSLYEAPTVKQIEALENGRLDIGILRAPIHSQKLAVETLYLDFFTIVMPQSYCAQLSVDEILKSIVDKPFIFFNKKYAPNYYEKLIEICARLGFKPSIQHEANNVHSIIQLVEAGIGVTILPMSLERQYGHLKVKFIPLDHIPISTEVVLAYKLSALNRVMVWFINRYNQLNKQIVLNEKE